MGAANDLIVLFIGLETLSLAFYVLSASYRRKAGSSESGHQVLRARRVLVGVLPVRHRPRLRRARLDQHQQHRRHAVERHLPSTATTRWSWPASALLLVGLGFKVAAVPFHVWTPDVYQGAPTPVTAFMASVGKVAAFAALMRVVVVALPFYRDDWRPVVWVLAVLSMVVGAVLAVVQTDVKRMLAYSSISHAGFILVGVEAAAHRAGEVDSGLGVPSALVYLLRLRRARHRHVRRRRPRRPPRRRATPGSTPSAGRRGNRPALALALTMFLVAQAGVPFTSGFIAKFGVIRGRRRRGQLPLAVIAMVASVIAAFLYLRIIVAMWMTDAEADAGDEIEPCRSRCRAAWPSPPPSASRSSSACSPSGSCRPPRATTQFAR